MSIKIMKPYKIAIEALKRYEAHYKIPALRAVIIPQLQFGDEVSCDVRWEDEHGQMQLQQKKFFTSDSLIPLNPLVDSGRHELWQHYYEQK